MFWNKKKNDEFNDDLDISFQDDKFDENLDIDYQKEDTNDKPLSSSLTFSQNEEVKDVNEIILDVEDNSVLLFEIEGIPRRENTTRHRSYIGVYDDHILIELDGECDYIELSAIYDIYVKEPIVDDVTSRETTIKFYEKGDTNWYDLEDSTFASLSQMIENVLKTHWTHFKKNQQYPQTIEWFIACASIVYIASQVNPSLYGGEQKQPSTAATWREVLYESWSIGQDFDFQPWPEILLNGHSMNNYRSDLEDIENLDDEEIELINLIKHRCPKNGIWAWDLQRLIFLCSIGYICDYIRYEDALDYSLKAGQKLQEMYHSWDEFMESYLYGYAYWSGEALDDEYSEVYMRKNIYEFYKGKANSPWAIDWKTPLKKEW